MDIIQHSPIWHRVADGICVGKEQEMIDLWIRNKYTGHVHRIGDDSHDCLMVDDEGTVHYHNLQCGDGCTGYKSINKETLADRYPDHDWGKRSSEYTFGYEFVPNVDDYGFPYDPTKKDINEILDGIKAEIEAARYGLINDGLDVALRIIDKHMKGR